MKFAKFVNGKFKILGITIFKFRNKQSGIRLCVMNIPLFKVGQKMSKLVAEIKSNTDFDMKKFDDEIASLIPSYTPPKVDLKRDRIAYLATIIYDVGGHTKCIRDLSESLSDSYTQKLFLTQISECVRVGSNSIMTMGKYIQIYGVDTSLFFNLAKKVKNFTDEIIKFAPKTLMVYIHPDDIFGTAVLSLIKKYTDIRIIFFNHASHYPSLGMTIANTILECIPTTRKITEEKRHLSNCEMVTLQSLSKNGTIYYSAEELSSLKQSLEVSNNDIITMSGGTAYKFFEDNKSSQYFEMIKRLLLKEPLLKHIIISDFNRKLNGIINDIFKNTPDIRKRLIIVPLQTNFDIYFQCADVFIDSFPVSSALTQIDLMRNKVASVVKVNREKPEFSFHEYQMPDYPYMFENVEDMENAIIELLHDKQKRTNIINKNYNFWLNTYERNVVKEKYIKIIEGIK